VFERGPDGLEGMDIYDEPDAASDAFCARCNQYGVEPTASDYASGACQITPHITVECHLDLTIRTAVSTPLVGVECPTYMVVCRKSDNRAFSLDRNMQIIKGMEYFTMEYPGHIREEVEDWDPGRQRHDWPQWARPTDKFTAYVLDEPGGPFMVNPVDVAPQGFREYNGGPHLLVRVPDGPFTISTITSAGDRAVFAFTPYKTGGPAGCVDVEVGDEGSTQERPGTPQQVIIFGYQSRKPDIRVTDPDYVKSTHILPKGAGA